MEAFGQTHSYEAVFFRAPGKKEIGREMLYAEFEAILDGVVGLNDYAGKEVEAIYTVISKTLDVRALVFFLIRFEEDGYADPSWNVPLHHLADIGDLGPDLGGGPVRIASKEHCNISWHTDQLWSAEVSAGSALLEEIRQVVLRNRLGLIAAEKAAPQAPAEAPVSVAQGQPAAAAEQAADSAATEPGDGAVDGRMNDLLQQQVERVNRLHKQHEQQLNALAASHQAETRTLEADIGRLRTELEQARSEGKQAQQALDQAKAKLQQLESDLDRERSAGGEIDTEAVRQDLRAELRAELEQELAAMRDQLETRQAETAYLKEIESQLREELAEAREARRELLSEGGGNILERLHKSGVVFVAYHPGVGHMPIPLKDIAAYTESPEAYVAAKCNVTEQQYREWRAHWESPRCQGKKASGEACGERLERVEQPARYVHGKSNLCVVCQSRVARADYAAGA